MNPSLVTGKNVIPESTYLQGDQAAPSTTVQPQSAPAGKQPSWWEKLLPTIGGIGGGLLGTLVSPIAGSMAGGAAGGALGQEAENLLTGDKGSVLGAGAENALGMGVGGIAGKGLGALADLGGGLAGKGAALTLGHQFGGELDPDLIENLLSGHGIQSADEAGQIGAKLTGSSDSEGGQALINKAVEDGINKSGTKVDITDLIPYTGKSANDISALNGSTLHSILNESQGLSPQYETKVLKQVAQTMGKQGTNIGGETDSQSALDLMRNFRNKGYSLEDEATRGRSSELAGQKMEMAKVYKGIGSEIQDRLFSPGGQELELPQDVKDSLVSDIQKQVGPINQKAADTISNAVQGTNNYKDLASTEGNWVKVSKALDSVAKKSKVNFGASPTDIAAGTLGVTQGPAGMAKAALGSVLNTKPVAEGSTSLLSGIQKLLGSKGTQTLIPLLSKVGATGLANLPNIASSGSPTPQSGNIDTGATMQPDISTLLNQSPTMQAYNTALTGGMGVGSPYTTAMTTLAPEAQKLAMAAPILQQLLGGYGMAGGPQGPLSGGIAKLTGIIPGTAANTFNREQGATASILAQLLGITPAAAQTALPQLTQTPGVAAPQITSFLGALGAV